MAVAAGLAELTDGVAEVVQRELQIGGDGQLARLGPWAVREDQRIVEPALGAEAEQQFAAVIAGEEIGHAAVIALGGVVLPRIADGVDGIVVVIQASLCEVGAQLGRDLVIPGLANSAGGNSASITSSISCPHSGHR
jgi:hypothetical protein